MADRKGMRAGLENWRAHGGSPASKARLAARNTWRKVRTRSQCCGNHGEPGC